MDTFLYVVGSCPNKSAVSRGIVITNCTDSPSGVWSVINPLRDWNPGGMSEGAVDENV